MRSPSARGGDCLAHPSTSPRLKFHLHKLGEPHHAARGTLPRHLPGPDSNGAALVLSRFLPHDGLTNLTRFTLRTFDCCLSIELGQLLEILVYNPTLQSLEPEGLYSEVEDEESYYGDPYEVNSWLSFMPDL